jgi:hypothetical protein
MQPTTQGMRQRGAYVAIESKLVNPHSQENSVENIDCDKEARQGARRRLPSEFPILARKGAP